jgi:hypothetical protein
MESGIASDISQSARQRCSRAGTYASGEAFNFRKMEYQMNSILRALVVLHVLVPLHAFAADDKVLLELNTVEPSENRCRLNFVVENRSEVALDTLKLDLVFIWQRRRHHAPPHRRHGSGPADEDHGASFSGRRGVPSGRRDSGQ